MGVETRWEEEGSVTAPTPLWSQGGATPDHHGRGIPTAAHFEQTTSKAALNHLPTLISQLPVQFPSIPIPVGYLSPNQQIQFVMTQICFQAQNNHIYLKKYKPNEIRSHQLLNCNQDMFINDVNIFTAFLYKRNVHHQPQKLESSEPFPRLYGTINAYGLLCLFNFALA